LKEKSTVTGLQPNLSLNMYEEMKKLAAGYCTNDAATITKLLSAQFFTTEELVSSSISGKKSAKSGDVCRPPLNAEKVGAMENVVREKCGINRKEFVEKLQNVQKVLRRLSTVVAANVASKLINE
jgi:hypothetical protein